MLGHGYAILHRPRTPGIARTGGSTVECPSPQRLVVDRGPVRDRLGLLRARADARLRAAGRLGGRRDGVLRRLDLLHLGGAAAVPRGGERRPRTGRRRAPADAPADLRATPDRLVVDADPARRHPLLQRRHVPGDGAELRHLAGRPARLEAGAVRLDLLPDRGRAGLPRGPRRRHPPRRAQPRVEDRHGQPARLHPVHGLGDRRLRRPVDRRRARPRRRKPEHGARSPLLPDRGGPAAPRIGR